MFRAILLTFAAMIHRQAEVATLVPQPGQFQFGNVIYVLPQGWTMGRNDDGVQVILSDLPEDLCAYCYVYVSAGFPSGGTLADFLSQHQADFTDAEDRAGIAIMAPPAPLTASGQQAMMMGIKIGSDFQILVAYDLGQRFELLAFEGYAYDQAELTEGMAVFSDQISPMFDSLQFVSAGAQSLLPAPTPGTLSGLYWGTALEQSWGIDLTLRFDIVSHSYFFWTDGQFYNGTPTDGLRPLNRAALLAAGDVNFGVYRQQGDKIILTYSTGIKQELTVSGTSLVLDDLTLDLTPPMADGSRIEGTISAFSYSGFTPGAGIDGGMSASSSTTFFKDGTYIGESFGGGFGTFDLGGGGFSTGSSDTTGGQYAVRDGLITLTPNDGSAPGSRIIVDTSDGIMIADQFLE
jgi:hypothetical protein